MIRIMKAAEVSREEIFERKLPDVDVSGIVRDIIEDVRRNGDRALLSYTKIFDGAELKTPEVSEEEFREAEAAVAPEFTELLKEAAANIRAFHSRQLREGFEITNAQGGTVGQFISPIEKVGLYVPGGTAAYPSTVLMDTIPAKIAGSGEIVIMTPPGKDGKVAPEILAAARLAGATRVFKAGGAQAIAALAFGTESVPKVYKIVGPGNAFVAEAKRQVFGQVAIDMIAGPSEILVVADGKSRPDWVAADLLSQAEHDRSASAVLVTDSEALAQAVAKELDLQLATLERREIAEASIVRNGRIIVTGSLEEALETANEIAPEHLELCVEDPFRWLKLVKAAGSVFLGRYCPEPVGDYFAGANHTLPTGGTARFSGALSVDDFVKKTQYMYYTREAMEKTAEKVGRFAAAEGLYAHKASTLKRLEAEE